MRRLINRLLLRRAGYEISRISRDHFTVAGIRYEVDPCAVGQTPEGETVARGAIRMLGERRLRSLRVLDLGCGVGIIGLTILSAVEMDGVIDRMSFADINIFNLTSLRRTLESNGLGERYGNRIAIHLSDGMKHIPPDEQFDIILCNPPHYRGVDLTKGSNATLPRGVGTYDAEWRFHASVYSQCHAHLAPGGEVWFFENGSAATAQDFLPFIQANQALRHVETVPEPLDPRFFWMITERA
jgi:SAM-dependent methyltransferase